MYCPMESKSVAAVLLVACLVASSGADSVSGDTVLGSTAVYLELLSCLDGECNLANLVTEAMLNELVGLGEPGTWTEASIAATNAGAIQDSIIETKRPGGAITVNDLHAVLPWNNTCDFFEVKGGVLLQALERSATKLGTQDFMHWAGLRVCYDMSAPVNARVKCASVLCRRCRVPQYEAIQLDEWYRITTNNYVADGGDGYTMFPANLRNRVVGRLDTSVVGDFIRKRSPIAQGIDGRTGIRNSCYHSLLDIHL